MNDWTRHIFDREKETEPQFSDEQCEHTDIVGGGWDDSFLMRCVKPKHDDDLHSEINVGRIPREYKLVRRES